MTPINSIYSSLPKQIQSLFHKFVPKNHPSLFSTRKNNQQHQKLSPQKKLGFDATKYEANIFKLIEIENEWIVIKLKLEDNGVNWIYI